MTFHHPKPPPPPPLLLLLTCASLLPITHSLTCSSQNFTNNLYTNCTVLPTLNASLYFNHQPKPSHLSIAFVAPPSAPSGWIAWAINPTGTGMAGSQALIAFKDANGSMTVNTYNISSYSSILKGKISFEVLDSRAEYSAGSMKIYATVKLPETMTEVNHVWQVGGSVVDGVPVKHEFRPENLNAKGRLKLVEKAHVSGRTVGSPADAPNPSPSSSPSSGCRKKVMYVFLLVVVGGLVFN